MPETELTFTAKALARISGISRGQLIRWDRDGLIRAPRRRRGEGGRVSDAAYTREQALGVLALGELQRRGVSHRRIRTAASVLPMISTEHEYLIFDGRLVHARRTEVEVVDLASGLGNGCQVLRVGRLAKKLVQA